MLSQQSLRNEKITENLFFQMKIETSLWWQEADQKI